MSLTASQMQTLLQQDAQTLVRLSAVTAMVNTAIESGRSTMGRANTTQQALSQRLVPQLNARLARVRQHAARGDVRIEREFHMDTLANRLRQSSAVQQGLAGIQPNLGALPLVVWGVVALVGVAVGAVATYHLMRVDDGTAARLADEESRLLYQEWGQFIPEHLRQQFATDIANSLHSISRVGVAEGQQNAATPGFFGNISEGLKWGLILGGGAFLANSLINAQRQ